MHSAYSLLKICLFVLGFLFLLGSPHLLSAQRGEKATVSGTVVDIDSGEPIDFATVYIDKTSINAQTDTAGFFSLSIPAYERLTLVIMRVGYTEARIPISPLSTNGVRNLQVQMTNANTGLEVVVTDKRNLNDGMVREKMDQLKLLPTTTGNLESVLPHLALGTSSGTGGELSSQYNVRGGNYDENLVYVNDFEIYRPQLVRAGQQEGLTFANFDLTRDISFSSGGFEARYGDKLSSVLDIRYKRPDSLRASIQASFLGGSAHLEGSFKVGKNNYQKLRYLVGARYKTTRYLLGSLQVKGEYGPDFVDLQTYITYDFSRDWQLGLMLNYNSSTYRFVPRDRETLSGGLLQSIKFVSVFEGQEVDKFLTRMGGLSLTYLPDRKRNPFFLKFLASGFLADETEKFDILSYYLIGQAETSLGSDNFGEIVNVLGVGTQHQYVRNKLLSDVYNFEHKGGYELQQDHDNDKITSSHFFQWSVKYQLEKINDQLNEWERLDSAGYSLRNDAENLFLLSVFKTKNTLNSNRINGYLQDTWTYRVDGKGELKVNAGIRATYWSLNQELNFSPRVQLLYQPTGTGKKDISYRLSGGWYVQPPFYRELRRINGTVNTEVQSQKSFHIVGGFTYDFFLGKHNPSKFRLIAEAYYKSLWDLVSYDVDNVRIRYSGSNDATGYATGLDLRINGEFVPGAESWINFSFLRTREALQGVTHFRYVDGQPEQVKDVPRPSDRFMNMSMFFQDYLRKNKNFRMQLNFTVGTGLPYGIPINNIVYRNAFRFDAYHRVDIGFSAMLWDLSKKAKKPHHFLRFTRSTWASLEVFNLLEVLNAASYVWVKTIYNTQYGVPNYLTSRRINLRVRMDF